MIEQLELPEFRRRVVADSFAECLSLADALKELLFVQADPIRAPARAQDLMLRQRIAKYNAGELEEAFPDLDVEEGYLFAYGFMTPEIWRDLRWRPHRGLKKQERAVLDAVSELGEVHPRDLATRFGKKSVKNYWGGKSQETKRILEKLHHCGYLRVSRRENGIRIYQSLNDPGSEMADPLQRYRRLALGTATVFGPTTQRFLVAELRSHNYLLPTRKERVAAVDSLVESGELSKVEVDGVVYLCQPGRNPVREVPRRVRILAPFDPLVRDRERFEQLWGWTYRFEAYVPEAKRERGYYAMPVLWRDEVIGWANARVEDGRLKVQLGYATQKPKTKEFRRLAEAEVNSMAKFLGLEHGAWELLD